MRKRIAIVAIAAIGAMATMLASAGAASAASGTYYFCTSSPYGIPSTLGPGQDCRGFGPLNIFRVYGVFEIRSPGNGAVCVGIVRNGTMTPLNDYAQPAGWNQTGAECTTVNGATVVTWRTANRQVVAGFGAVPGQPVMLNFSTATVRSVDYTRAGYYY